MTKTVCYWLHNLSVIDEPITRQGNALHQTPPASALVLWESYLWVFACVTRSGEFQMLFMEQKGTGRSERGVFMLYIGALGLGCIYVPYVVVTRKRFLRLCVADSHALCSAIIHVTKKFRVIL